MFACTKIHYTVIIQGVVCRSTYEHLVDAFNQSDLQVRYKGLLLGEAIC